jgi:hypothetical protein
LNWNEDSALFLSAVKRYGYDSDATTTDATPSVFLNATMLANPLRPGTGITLPRFVPGPLADPDRAS